MISDLSTNVYSSPYFSKILLENTTSDSIVVNQFQLWIDNTNVLSGIVPTATSTGTINYPTLLEENINRFRIEKTNANPLTIREIQLWIDNSNIMQTNPTITTSNGESTLTINDNLFNVKSL